jgi:tripeptide aminopeptidase
MPFTIFFRISMPITIDTNAAVERLMRFLGVPGITGQEAAIAADIRNTLIAVGVPAEAIRYDDCNARIPLPTQTGNLIVTLPGTLKAAPRRLFMTHMDTVPLCAGAKPVRGDTRITNGAATALGGDNRTGCAVLVTLAAELIQQKLPHPPLTLLFTVREESGLFGAKHLNPTDLGGAVMGFNFDSRNASDLVHGAIGADRWEVDIFGKASHAGVHPEKGISSTAVASIAIADVMKNGWFGKVIKNGKEGTSNVGQFGDAAGNSAGNATNVVTDHVHIKGESRSHDAKFVREITAAYKTAFEKAAKQVKDHQGKTAKVKFTSRLDYVPFRIPVDSPVMKMAVAAAKSLKLKPHAKVTNGGLDANWMVKHGIPTVTMGAGQNEIHTVKEWVDLKEFANGCKMALALATME